MDQIRQSMNGGLVQSVIRILFIVLMFYLLYVLYNYLYSTSDLNDFSIYKGPHLGRTLLGEGVVAKNTEVE